MWTETDEDLQPPQVRVMTEREILASFQITQSMVAWWLTGMC